jgi:peptidoglycan/xylan/chitin deacetylase (PgdA/CDA1 family)
MPDHQLNVRRSAGTLSTRRRHQGYSAFCAALAVAIVVLGLGSLRPGRAAAGHADRSRHGDGVAQQGSPGSGSGTGGGDGGTAASLPDVGPTNPTIDRLIQAGQPIYCGGGTKPLVALTFDDGPGPDTVGTIDQLRAASATATFFEVGKLLGESMFDGIPRAAARFGAVGDHTWNHISMLGLARGELDAEIDRTRRALQQLTGESVYLFRPPLGRHDDRVDAYVRSHGMLEILWSVDSGDSQGANDDRIYQTVRDQLSPGDIVLLHENRGTTQNALPRILDLIRERDYTAVTVPQLLTMDPPTAEQLRHHSCP